jgi:hypothetical protein
MTDLEWLRQQAAGDRERHERQLEEDKRQRLAELPAEVARLGEPLKSLQKRTDETLNGQGNAYVIEAICR